MYLRIVQLFLDLSLRNTSRQRRSQRHLRLVCSCDRYNYGDLLFPIVTRWALKTIAGCSVPHTPVEYGLKRSDLSAFGALPSRSMSDLYHDVDDGDVVLLAGGENLAQTWFVMHLTLLGGDAPKRLMRWQERLGPAFSERISRWRFGGRQEFPYILSPDQFPHSVRVMYNSMGGWPLAHYPRAEQISIVRALEKASFISVREEESASILRTLDTNIRVRVAPDCVFLLSDMLSKEELARKASVGVRELVSEAGEFLCFQCHPRYGEANRQELERELRALAGRSGLSILLAPIGRIHSFDDDAFLAPLGAVLGDCSRRLPAWASIYDVAYALSSARLFCGTSLHGVITAFTYGVPFVPLMSEDPKLENNVKGWDLHTSFPATPASAVADQGLRTLELSGRFLAESAERLRIAARSNMRDLAKHILAD
jgi:hypothetical protein